jgi:hypothetical protein
MPVVGRFKLSSRPTGFFERSNVIGKAGLLTDPPPQFIIAPATPVRPAKTADTRKDGDNRGSQGEQIGHHMGKAWRRRRPSCADATPSSLIRRLLGR